MLAVSGVVGFAIGITRFATWQVAVESAQAVAGLVTYPVDHPFYIYHMKLWTVAHQVCALLLWAGVSEITLSKLLDRTNNPLYAAAAAEREGMLATGGTFHLVQLYTRRPVLLDGGALDEVTYAPAGGPRTARILREVYGIDFFNPPEEAKRVAGVPHRVNKPIWEGYSRLKWQEIRHDFGVTQVLTRADWVLDLPIEAEDQFLKLYRIPR